MRFSWEIKSVDALFCNGMTKVRQEDTEEAAERGNVSYLWVYLFRLAT